MHGSRQLICAAVFLGVTACSSSSKTRIEWTDSVANTAGITVSFEGGSQVQESSVRRTGETSAEVWFRWVPGAHSGVVEAEFVLYPADGGKEIDLSPLILEARSGMSAEVQVWVDEPRLAADHGHWLALRLKNDSGEIIQARPFPGNWVSLGAIPGQGVDLESHPQDEQERLTLAVGGDANLGRRQNGITSEKGAEDALERLPDIGSADVTYLNLECVISHGGEEAVAKGEPVPFYFRGRPEMVEVLVAAGVDVVGTANNHAGDYGPSALIEQGGWLRKAGIGTVGSGGNLEEACAPVYLERGGVTIGFMAADLTLSLFAAGADSPGTCHLSPKDPELAMATIGPGIDEMRRVADVVFVGLHWGRNRKSRPSTETRALGARIIRAGADAILGSSAHYVQGVEIVDGRPILYDTGNLLFDSHAEGELTRSGVFLLTFDQRGVTQVRMKPIDLDYGFSRPAAGNSAARSLARFRDLSAELGTVVTVEDSTAIVALPLPPDRSPPTERIDPPTVERQPVKPAASAPGCEVQEVPEAARIEPVEFGPLRLLGVRTDPTVIQERKTVWLETWWTVSRPVVDDLWMYQRVKSTPHDPRQMWWADHEHCDWAWPTSRWTPGVVVRDHYGLRPPKRAKPGKYDVFVGIRRYGEMVGTDRMVASVVFE